MVVALTKVTRVAASPSKVTVAPLTKSVPVILTTVPPAVGPLVGAREVIEGGSLLRKPDQWRVFGCSKSSSSTTTGTTRD